VNHQPEPGSEQQFAFDDERERKFQELLPRYATKMAVLLPALWLAQEQNGYVTTDIMEYIAGRLDLSPVHVYSVAHFYTMYHKKQPGKYHVQVCRTLSCMLCGGEDIQAHLADKYGLRPGEVTEDGVFSMETVECLGSCGTAPVMRINDIYCENLTIEKVDKIMQTIKAGEEIQEDPVLPH
jgi:NADH-quinone oxidoreductase subunit E